MKSRFALGLIVLVSLILAGGFAAADKKMEKMEKMGKMAKKKITVQGEVVDMACYISHEAKGPDHAACASKCVKGGQPMGLLTDDGKVFLLFSGHDDATAFNKTKEYAGKKVEITGLEYNRAGINGVTVKGVKPL